MELPHSTPTSHLHFGSLNEIGFSMWYVPVDRFIDMSLSIYSVNGIHPQANFKNNERIFLSLIL